MKKKHESGFFEDNLLNEPVKMDCHPQSDRYRYHRETATREPADAMAKKQNGETIASNTSNTTSYSHSQRPMDLLDLTRTNETDNRNAYGSPKQQHSINNHNRVMKESSTATAHNSYSPHNRDMIGSSDESKWYGSGRHRNQQFVSGTNSVTRVVNHDAIVISDEDDDDDDEEEYTHSTGTVLSYCLILSSRYFANENFHSLAFHTEHLQ